MELIDPAVVGTLNVLNSCAKAKSVRRVVLTSSTAAVRMRADLDNITAPLDESVWSDLQFCTKYKVSVYLNPDQMPLVANSNERCIIKYELETMSGKNRQLVTDEPVEFEKFQEIYLSF